ncbi:MAG: DNA replication/repair protein RecF [Firmicutes bacterium]|nr:DNA replication/repair protein RecF [Bacillota bacterium]
MRLLTLGMRNFRNYEEAQVELGESLNVVTGPNAQGKTNFLEAIYVLATGRSHRTARDMELVMRGRAEAALCGRAVRHRTGTTFDIQVRIRLGRRKDLLLNGHSLRGSAELLGQLTVVAFSPDDLLLVKGGPPERRRFLDVSLAQVSEVYKRTLINYHRVLKQRNALLKGIQLGSGHAGLLEEWDRQLIESGARVMEKRAQAVEILSGLAADVYASLTDGKEKLLLKYLPFFTRQRGPRGEEAQGGAEGNGDGAIRKAFEEALARLRRAEVATGQTLLGPQRDDLGFQLDGLDAQSYASQGQQRSIVLACRLAEVEFIRRETGEFPLILLDDVMSELDQSRRARLVGLLDEGRTQALVTAAALQDLGAALTKACRVYSVDHGRLWLKTAGEE